MSQRLVQLLIHWPILQGRRVRPTQASRAAPGTNPGCLAELLLYPSKLFQIELVEIMLGFRNGPALNGDLTVWDWPAHLQRET